MTTTYSKILGRLGLGASTATLAIGLAVGATPALAQTAPTPDTAGISPVPTPSETNGGTIVVTGSRIPQPNLTSVAPVTVVSPLEIKQQGTVRLEDLLNSLPQVFAGQASSISNGSNGTATVDLRDLGEKRTLVLINGRRLLPGDPSSSAADINAIPEALIKRVDVLTGGASSTYGADAVAGVVNFIMDTDFSGIRADAQYSVYQHDNNNSFVTPLLAARRAAGLAGYGQPVGNAVDGPAYNANLTLGAGFDDNRGHVTAYFGYRQVKPILQNQRDYSQCTIQNVNATRNQCGGSATSGNGNAILYASGTSTFFNIGPNRTLVPGLTRYNFAPTNYYQRPDERYTAGFFAHYDVSDHFKPYMEFMFMDDRTRAQIAPSGDFGNTLQVNCDNPLISAQQASIICAPGNLVNGYLGTYPLTTTSNPGAVPITFRDPVTGAAYNRAFFQLLRRNIEGGARVDDREHTEYRGLIGAKGDLNKAFSYDAYYQYSRTLLSETYLNDFSRQRLTNALDVVSVNGVPTCRVTEAGTDASCVPYDVFGNNVTGAALGYLSVPGFQRGLNTEQVANASITGLLGEYGITSPFASDGVSFNVGVEYRKEGLSLLTDNEFSTGDLTGQGAPTKSISGSFNVTEGFGELQVPLVHDNFLYDASINAGYRYSKYELSSGGGYKTNTFKVGGEIAPIRDIRFRAGYNRAVRAPNLQELFAPTIVALDGASDPCAGITITAANTGCLLQGLRVGQRVVANPAGQYNGQIGGNLALRPERANTFTAGVVLQPRFLPRFALSVDYYSINVKNAIQAFGADNIIAACTNSLNTFACSLIHRNPVSGTLWLTPDSYISDTNFNIGGQKTSGVDVNASYVQPISGLGSVSASLVGTYLRKFVTNNGLSAAYDCAGYYGIHCGVPLPKWRHQFRLTYNAPFGFSLSGSWRYFAPVKVDYLSSNPSLKGANIYDPGSHIKSQSYFDLTASVAVADHYTFRLGVKNIFDKEPPLVTSGLSSGAGSNCAGVVCNGNTYPAVYDSLGRYLFASITFNY